MSNEPNPLRPTPALAEVFIPERASEIAFWSDLALDSGRIVINWHCGTGELTVGLAKRGLRVVGVDGERDAIDVAVAREADSGVEQLLLTWINREPRLASLPGLADFAILSDEVLGNYLQEDQRIGLLKNVLHHLRPGGVIGLSVPMAPRSGVIHNKHISGPLRALPRGIFARRVSTLKYDAERSILAGKDEVLVRLPDGEHKFVENYTRRLYTPDEIFSLLYQVGFTNVGMWGGWDKRPLRQAESLFIVRAERPMIRAIGKKLDEDTQPQQEQHFGPGDRHVEHPQSH
jgi:2-polyprenyl-3-methyl-5-hydroxy-6-metoxy-1,4-benzoquinol methylase